MISGMNSGVRGCIGLNKTIAGIPYLLYYYPSYPSATVHLYAVPSDTYTLSLDSLKPITALVLDTDMNMPPEYEEAIKWNLAVRLAPDYKATPRPDVVQLARTSYAALSIQPIPMAFCPDAPGNNSRGRDRNFIQSGR